jgi:hypothetical protein
MSIHCPLKGWIQNTKLLYIIGITTIYQLEHNKKIIHGKDLEQINQSLIFKHNNIKKTTKFINNPSENKKLPSSHDHT